MTYQQQVYAYMVRHADPVSLGEIIAATELPRNSVAHSLTRLRRRGRIKATRPQHKLCRWFVVDYSVTWIPDLRGSLPQQRANLRPPVRTVKA